jgi:RNA polymerase sigma-70 factor (ECF subfamily)
MKYFADLLVGGEKVKDRIDGYYKTHGKLVYCYLYQMTKNADLAEELTQETFYQAMRTVDKYRGDCKPSTWLCQIARHIWYQYLDRNHKVDKQSIQGSECPIQTDASIDNLFWDRQDKIELYKRIQNLDKVLKDVIYLRLSGDLSFAEIGEIMGESENWARVSFYRGKQKLMKGEGV